MKKILLSLIVIIGLVSFSNSGAYAQTSASKFKDVVKMETKYVYSFNVTKEFNKSNVEIFINYYEKQHPELKIVGFRVFDKTSVKIYSEIEISPEKINSIFKELKFDFEVDLESIL